MGVAVFSGMLGVTFFGLLLTPLFYLLLRKLAHGRRLARALEKEKALAHAEPAASH